jgi:hypothetical protein
MEDKWDKEDSVEWEVIDADEEKKD